MLTKHDGTWCLLFAEFAAGLRDAGDESWTVEHIGSTAIPGLAAKPIVDLAVRIEDDEDFERHRPALEAAGWSVGSGVRTHRVMLRESEGVRLAIAHFFPAAEWDTVDQRLFRDWLLGHPRDRDRYEAVKREAAEAAAAGVSAYNAAKTGFIQEIVDRARAALELPSVPVGDK